LLPTDNAEFVANCLLGVLIYRPETIPEVRDTFDLRSFEHERHRLVYKAILDTSDAGYAVNVSTVYEALGKQADDVGGVPWLVSLEHYAGSPADVKDYIRLIEKDAEQRQVRGLLSEAEMLSKLGAPNDAILTRLSQGIEAIESRHARVPRLKTWTGVQLLNTEFTRNEMIGGGILSKGHLAVLAGAPKSGKSLLMLDMLSCLLTGTSWLGCPVPNACRVLLLSGEGGPNMIRDRIGMMTSRLNPEALERLFVWWPQEGDTLSLSQPESRRLVIERAKEYGADLIVIDPLVRLHGANENDTSEMRDLCEHIREINRRTGAGVLVLHHTRKPGLTTKSGSAMEMRGSSVLHAEADTTLILVRKRNVGQYNLSFELRWVEEPPTKVLTLDAATLQFNVEVTLDGTTKRKLTGVALYKHLSENGPASIQELIEQLGVSDSTVRNAKDELDFQGAISVKVATHGKKIYHAVPGFFEDEDED
jgi:replicative DNA helicase